MSKTKELFMEVVQGGYDPDYEHYTIRPPTHLEAPASAQT